jgi:hypothetical protein
MVLLDTRGVEEGGRGVGGRRRGGRGAPEGPPALSLSPVPPVPFLEGKWIGNVGRYVFMLQYIFYSFPQCVPCSLAIWQMMISVPLVSPYYTCELYIDGGRTRERQRERERGAELVTFPSAHQPTLTGHRETWRAFLGYMISDFWAESSAP